MWGKKKEQKNSEVAVETQGKQKRVANAKTFGVFIFGLLLVGFLIPTKLMFVSSPSVGARLFFLDKNPENLKKGDYVVFPLKSKTADGKAIMVTKQIACDEGETLKTVNKQFWCNGNKLLGEAKDISLTGEKLEHFIFDGIIPQGYTFVMGHHKDSYDSRYFGFVKKSEVKAKAYPIL